MYTHMCLVRLRLQNSIDYDITIININKMITCTHRNNNYFNIIVFIVLILELASVPKRSDCKKY